MNKLLPLLLALLMTGGCAAPRWIALSTAEPDDAVNGKHMKRLVAAAVAAAADFEAGQRPYELVLPGLATPETYAEITHRLGADALVPEGVPAVAVRPDGRAQRRDPAVIEAEKLNPPVPAVGGAFPRFEVRSVRLNGQTAEVDVVRPLRSGRRKLTVSLDLDPGYGWRSTGVRMWRGLDPDSDL